MDVISIALIAAIAYLFIAAIFHDDDDDDDWGGGNGVIVITPRKIATRRR